MARLGKDVCKRKAGIGAGSENTSSDDTDEDSVGSEDELLYSSADFKSHSSLKGKSILKREAKGYGTSIALKSVQGKRHIRVSKERRNMESYKKELDIDDDDCIVPMRMKRFTSSENHKPCKGEEKRFDNQSSKKKPGYIAKPGKRSKISRCKVEEEEDIDENDFEVMDVDRVCHAATKGKPGSCSMQKVVRHTNGENAKFMERIRRKKSTEKKASSSKNDYNGKESKNGKHIAKRKRGMKLSKKPDLDSVNSGSSDYEYTISEEEREQVREASKFCGTLSTGLRSSSSLKKIKEEEAAVSSQRVHQNGKGKGKMVDLKIELCGICLSEEGKSTVTGIIDCCSHYFCFSCIMEWAKVESRCPLCKKRFLTINRAARNDGARDPWNGGVIHIPKRDQVYQPSEEELRGFLDPYENVVCTECQQGEDDALMLLCDLCDSPAHSYCVGLGREVPEGNWYCNGCRLTALASSDTQALALASNNLSIVGSSSGVSFDLNEMYVPTSPSAEVNGVVSPSLRKVAANVETASPSSGSGALTLFDRRRIQRQIHRLLNSRSRLRVQDISHRGRLQNPDTTPLLYNKGEAEASTSANHCGVIHRSFFHQTSSRRPTHDLRELNRHFSFEKKQVQTMVKSELKCLSRTSYIGYHKFKTIARVSTHTILGALGFEHRVNQVYPIKTRPFQCDHLEGMVGCPSCFGWFVKSVVKEIACLVMPLAL